MVQNHNPDILTGEVWDEEKEISLPELCRTCQLPAERVTEYIEYGVIEPSSKHQTTLYFQVYCVKRIQRAQRLESDLGVNRAGAALALDLIDELNDLRKRLKHYEN